MDRSPRRREVQLMSNDRRESAKREDQAQHVQRRDDNDPGHRLVQFSEIVAIGTVRALRDRD